MTAHLPKCQKKLYSFAGHCTTSDTLSTCLIDTMTRFGLSMEDLRGQCYDGGANMAGVNHGVQAIIKKRQPKAIFAHCANLHLDLALQETVREVKSIEKSLSLVRETVNLIKESAKRQSCYECIGNDLEKATDDDY